MALKCGDKRKDDERERERERKKQIAVSEDRNHVNECERKTQTAIRLSREIKIWWRFACLHRSAPRSVPLSLVQLLRAELRGNVPRGTEEAAAGCRETTARPRQPGARDQLQPGRTSWPLRPPLAAGRWRSRRRARQRQSHGGLS